MSEESARATPLAKQPTARFTAEADIGALIAFLGSDVAEQIRGAALSIDGGWCEFCSPRCERPIGPPACSVAMHHNSFTSLSRDGRAQTSAPARRSPQQGSVSVPG